LITPGTETRDKALEVDYPKWFSIVPVILAIPEVASGAKIYELRSEKQRAAGESVTNLPSKGTQT
jgi:hypothetical protein